MLYLRAIWYAIIHRIYDFLDILDVLHWRFHDWAEDTVAFHNGGYQVREMLRTERLTQVTQLVSEARHEQTTIPDGTSQGEVTDSSSAV